jgi:hypothetical protein
MTLIETLLPCECYQASSASMVFLLSCVVLAGSAYLHLPSQRVLCASRPRLPGRAIRGL